MVRAVRAPNGYKVSDGEKTIWINQVNRTFDIVAGEGFDFDDITGLKYAFARDKAIKMFRDSFQAKPKPAGKSAGKGSGMPASALRGSGGNPLAEAAAALRQGDLRAAADALDKAAQ